MLRPILFASVLAAPCLLVSGLLLPQDPIAVGLLVAIGIATGVYSAPIEQYARHRPLLAAVGTASAAVLITAWLLWPNLGAWWGLVDDHEIPQLTSPGGTISAARVLSILRSHPEVGKPSFTIGRCRPAYHVLRMTELWLWGPRPWLWYAARMAMFALAIVLFWRCLQGWLGTVAAGAMVSLLLSNRCWPDIWCRLGPAEPYSVAGTAVFVAGMLRIWRIGSSSAPGCSAGPSWVWGLTTLGGLVAVGSKENFLILLPVLWAMAIWLAGRHCLGLAGLAASAIVTGYGLWIAYIVVMSVGRSGVDVYSQSVGLVGRLRLIIDGLEAMFSRKEYLCLAGTVGGMIFGLGRASTGEERARLVRSVLKWTAVVLGLGLVFLSQFFFYNGTIPRGTRYDFPAVLLPSLVGAAVLVQVRLFVTCLSKNRWASRLVWAAGVATMLVLALGRGVDHTRVAAAKNAERTTAFELHLGRISRVAAADPTRPIVFVAHHPYDHELVGALMLFLRLETVKNPLFLLVKTTRDIVESRPLFRSLDRSLRQKSERGDGEFRPWRELPPDVVPFTIGFSGEPVELPGKSLGCVWSS
ncbi:MAG: hypothetical protein HY815_27835 [Candidatus Riflebacteria bacterium]|nr:hypothetical protein [Candidatus Riflebacteria bacterium]